ncbi:efflux RND transporter permease subunit, partial [Candidatus Bipolaricaulota bacterium]|nr:efflux RND transporter permease subunit [Candidatus Bipolaricaulota bacterium]
RASLIIALTIPFSLIIAFFFFFLFEYTINMVSLMSLAIAVGIVVDNAIVVLENITRHIETGSRPTEASVYGTSEVGMAVMASTLTIVAVFAPMLFASGLVGIMFQQLAVVVIITVLASLFASLTLTPALASRLMYKTNNQFSNSSLLKRAHDASERWFNVVEGKYATLLSWALQNKKKTILVTVVVFIGSGGLVPFLSTEFIPQGDTGDIQVEFEMAPGTRMETAAAVAYELEQVFRDSIPEAKHVFTRVGQSSQAFSVAIGQAGGTHKGLIGAKLVEQKLRDRSSSEVANVIREYARTIPGILKLDIQAGNPIADILFGGDKPITIEIIGHDVEQTDMLAQDIKSIVENVPGTKDAIISRGLGRPELLVNINREKAALAGTNIAQISIALRTQVFGTEATQYREDGDE